MVIVGIGRPCLLSYNSAMRPATRYLRSLIVASLSLSLVFGGFCTAGVMGECPVSQSRQHAQKHCCCGANCQCGTACCGNTVPDQGQKPNKGTESDVRDLVKISPAVFSTLSELSFGQRFSKPISTLCGEVYNPQTLITQHTCLQV
jgi:hypothetical protein